MEKIINGKKYDTETATLVTGWNYGNWSDFKYVRENLYLTKKGQWFVAGEGGSFSKYGEQVGNGAFSCGEQINLISEDEAKEFIEKYGDSEIYEQYFEVEEG